MPELKLGKLAPKFNERTLSFSAFLRPDASFSQPAKLYREYKIPDGDWGMYGNDQMGDCTCAAKAHRMMLMTAHTGKMFVPDPADIMKAYIDLTGYNPRTGENDTGCAMTDVLQYEQITGIAGRKILGWAQIDHKNIDRVKQAMYVFGAVDIGVEFPKSAMSQFGAGKTWSLLSDDGGIDGGHDVPMFGYGAVGDSCVTWGKRQPMTWDWFRKYCDEAYVVITQDWVNEASGLAPNTMNMDALLAALRALRV
jgi:hypothetical protein